MHAMAVTAGLDAEDEIVHSAGRIISIAEGWIADPTPSEEMSSGMRSMAAYLVAAAGSVDADLEPPVVEPPVVEPPAPGQLDTQLHGKPLPARPSVNINLPRNDRYGAVVDDATRNFGGQHIAGVTSSGVLMKGTAGVSDVVFFGSGGDAMKVDGGPKPASITIKRVHLFGLGLSPGAHADGLQGRGNLTSALIEDVYFDQPTNKADGTRSNACVIIDSSQGPNGQITMRRCILRGGNRCIMMGDKGTGNAVGTIRFEDCAFIVERNSPRYTLFQPGFDSSLTFVNCAVYFYDNTTGTCTFVTDEVGDFNVKQWHLDMFGTIPVS